MRYKFLSLDIYHLDTTFWWARMWGSVVIFRSEKGSAKQNVWGHCRIIWWWILFCVGPFLIFPRNPTPFGWF